MVAATLVFDFEADLWRLYAGRLNALGARVKAAEAASDLMVRYYSTPRRRISREPRVVLWSVELAERCTHLPPDYQKALVAIERVAKTGGSLDAYQSRDLARAPWKSDRQLLEWGITHFHLGLVPDAKNPRMIAGTPDLLFAVVRHTAVHFIDVMPHASFSKQVLFDVATRNWPHLFEHAALVGVVGLEQNATDDERKLMRAAGINVMTQGANGRVYGPVGGGVTTSGASLAVVQQYVIPRTGPMRRWSILCEKEPDRVLAMIPAERCTGLTTIELHASENAGGEIVISATNVDSAPFVLGTGNPPA